MVAAIVYGRTRSCSNRVRVIRRKEGEEEERE